MLLPAQSNLSGVRPTHVKFRGRSGPHPPLRQLGQHNRTRSTTTLAASKTDLNPKEQQLLQLVMNYEYTLDLPEGQLVISPLRQHWLQRTGDLLADTFVDAKGVQPYWRYVRRNIGKYLDVHINLPPAAVVVTAVLRSKVARHPNALLALNDMQPDKQHSSSDSSYGASGGGSDSRQQDSSSGSSGAEPRVVENPLTQLLLTCFGWLVQQDKPDPTTQEATTGGPNGDNSQTSSSSSRRPKDAGAHTHFDAAVHTTGSSSSASSAGGTTAYTASSNSNSTGGSNNSSGRPLQAASSQASSSGSSSSDVSAAAGTGVAALMGNALRRLSDGVQLHQLRQQPPPQQQVHVVETLLGVAEVSFKESSRSQAITLNPPQRCAYLCNMAVSQDWRRKGIASALLTAVEDLCMLAGEPDLFLHLRFKDSDSAGCLYRKHGFTAAQRDCWLLLLIGQEPRYLMLKSLAADRTLAGRVALPGFPQGATAAALQQLLQQQEDDVVVQLQGQPGSSGEGAVTAKQPAPAPAVSPAA